MRSLIPVIRLCSSLTCSHEAVVVFRLSGGQADPRQKVYACEACLARVQEAFAERDPSWPNLTLHVERIHS